MGYSRKIHNPTMEGMLENLMGAGVNGFGNPDGREALNLKLHPRELRSSMFPSLQLKSFQKLLCIFKFYYIFKL